MRVRAKLLLQGNQAAEAGGAALYEMGKLGRLIALSALIASSVTGQTHTRWIIGLFMV